MELFQRALASCARLGIAVTNLDAGARLRDGASSHRHTAEANPSTFERARLLQAALADRAACERTMSVPFDLGRPDRLAEYVLLEAPHLVRAHGGWERRKARLPSKLGYDVEAIEGDPAQRLSASEIRRMLHDGAATISSTVGGSGGWRTPLLRGGRPA